MKGVFSFCAIKMFTHEYVEPNLHSKVVNVVGISDSLVLDSAFSVACILQVWVGA